MEPGSLPAPSHCVWRRDRSRLHPTAFGSNARRPVLAGYSHQQSTSSLFVFVPWTRKLPVQVPSLATAEPQAPFSVYSMPVTVVSLVIVLGPFSTERTLW